MTSILDRYAPLVGDNVIDQLRQLARLLQGLKVVHVNSTRVGGGVAEILEKLVLHMCDLGIDASWEVVQGEADFYRCTKSFHNALQGNAIHIAPGLLKAFEETNAENADRLRSVLEAADIVFIHDPQPAPLLKFIPTRRGKWIWRCHIDLGHPHRPVWKYLRPFVEDFNASVFSLVDFAPSMRHPVYIIPPSIDPLSEKNIDLDDKEVLTVQTRYGIDPDRPTILQVSRFDRFKDPIGVIRAYKLATTFVPSLQLVLAGGTATDDPEGGAVLAEVQAAAEGDPDIHILLLPPDAHRTINALQRAADIVLQKSTREGFGLTVTEAMWKGKPVIGGNVGGIRLQIFNHQTGFLVDTPEGAALRIRYLLYHRERLAAMGHNAREFVREHFLLTRHLREYLTLMVTLVHGKNGDRIQLG